MDTQVYQNLNKPFVPHRWVRSGHTQTVLARYRPRQLCSVPVEYPILLDAGKDMTEYTPDHSVRLLGYYTSSALPIPARGLVLMLHGWQGCSHSIYNLLMTHALSEAGFDVF